MVDVSREEPRGSCISSEIEGIGIWLDTDEFGLWAKDFSEGHQVVTAIAADFQDVLGLNCSKHLTERRHTFPPIRVVPVGIHLAEVAFPDVKLGFHCLFL